jgi:CheY-like chemotaxis protein
MARALQRSATAQGIMTNEPYRLRLLLVDDEPPSRNAITRLLTKHFALTAVDSAEEALACFDAGAFDLVLTDYRMPSMTGIELLEQLRVRDPHGRRLLMSASSVPGLHHYIASGLVEAFLTKPLDSKSVLTVLRRTP